MNSLGQSLDFATRALEGEMGQLTRSIFFFTDGVQRAVVDGMFDLLEPKTWRPASLSRMSWDAAKAMLELTQFVTPGEAGVSWEELGNKLEVFLLVSELSQILKLRAGEWIELPDLVERSYSLSPYAALWAVEGVGHYYGDAYWERYGQPNGLLREKSAQVPEKSLLMLHAGIGLSFADRLLNTVLRGSPGYAIRDVIEQFVTLCRDNCREGYLGPAVESLGLVTREFYPDMVGIVADHLQGIAPELEGYYWHGVGRALYFSRRYFLPVLRTVWDAVAHEAPPGMAQANAMAGLAWAATLVNMRQPKIMEGLLRYVEKSALADAFSYGVSTSIMMREDTTPNQPFVSAFYEHQPCPGNQKLVLTWNKRVAGPTKSAIRNYYPALKQHGRLGEIFQYQPLADVVDKLGKNSTQPAVTVQ